MALGPPTLEGEGAGVSLDWKDYACLAGLAILTALQLWRGFDFHLPPYEDAAILMRFAEHIAAGLGVVWNPGEAPIDGATDFLFLVALAGVSRLGLSIESSAQVLGIGFHVATCLFVYGAVRRLHGGPRWQALLSASFVAFGPGLRYVEAYFGTTFFAFFGAVTWAYAHALFKYGPTPRRSLGFAGFGLLMGLTRPDGALLACIILLGLLLLDGPRRQWRVLRDFTLVYGIIGGSYFAWRWTYFGHPLPNPFYVKGDFNLYPAHLVAAFRNLLVLTAPLAPLLLASISFGVLVLVGRAGLKARLATAAGFGFLALIFLIFRHSSEGREGVVKAAAVLFAGFSGLVLFGQAPLRALFPGLGEGDEHVGVAREAAFVGLVLLFFSLLWILLSGGMDYMMRYHYVMVPAVAIAWPPLFRGLAGLFGFGPGGRSLNPLAAPIGIGAFFVCTLGYQITTFTPVRHHRWGTLDVALILADYNHDYTIAVTNAGQLPFYSKWRCLDAWGLSDAWIPRNGIDAEYVGRWRPEVIQFDANYSPLIPEETIARPEHLRSTWYNATYILKQYAEDNGYELAGAFGITPYKAHYYYVRTDFPESAEIVRRIREVSYFIDGVGPKAIDYARIAAGGKID